MKHARVYDWMGTLLDMAGMDSYMRKHHAELYQAYGEAKARKSPDLAALRNQIIPLYEHAAENGLFPIALYADAKPRLEQDRKEGYVTTLFTGSPKGVLHDQLKELGLDRLVDETVVLDDLRRQDGLTDLTKEDPRIFEGLCQHLAIHHDLRNLDLYVDDTQGRVEAAVAANLCMQARGHRGFGRIYHLDRRIIAPRRGEGYRRIASLKDI
jgi:FMN phosphatase YigB (HAD superfamily)